MKNKSLFESPILSTKIKSANVKIFPEGGLGYLIGPTLALLANSILSGYFNKYMTDVLKINAWAAGFFSMLPLISVIFVVIGNILVGRLMDHKQTKAGKARPLLLLSIPISILALLTLFILSPFATDVVNVEQQTFALIMIAIGYNLWFAIAYPFYYTPHSALVNLSTRSSKDRSLLATLSNATGLAAMGLTSMILPFFLGLLFVENPDKTINQLASYNHWKIFVIALMVLTAIGTIVEYFFTRERITEESFSVAVKEEKPKTVSIKQQAKACFKDKFWIMIIVFFFLYQLGGLLKNVSQTYFCAALFTENNSTVDGGVFQGTLSIIGAIPTTLGMLVAWPLSNKIGKAKSILLGAVVAIIGGAIGFIDPNNFALVVTAFCIKAFGSTPAMYLSLALLADILDHQEALHGFRTDGLTMTIYGVIMGGMTGLATGIMNIVLSAVGYQAGVNSQLLQDAMTWLFLGGETICYVIIFVIFIFMGVEKFSKFDQKAIVMDQKAKANAEGVEYVDPATRLKLEEEEADRVSFEAYLKEVKDKCEKKGVSFEEEKQKILDEQERKRKALEEKKIQSEKDLKEKEAKRIAEFDKLPQEEKDRITAKIKAKEEKQKQKESAVLSEFNAMRERAGKPTVE
ncbi:MAG: MFS transporter [Clostridiales bacterium]|nr:MFS transporter [Clostridiales bacterium]